MHYNKDDMAIVRQLCHEAIALDPNWSKPYSILSTSYRDACFFGWTKACGEAHKLAFDFAHEAISLNESGTWAHLALSLLYRAKKQCDKSISEGAKAVAISPNGADANMIYAGILSHCGRNEEAIDRMKKAIHLNPIPPVWYPWTSGVIFFRAGRYKEAIPKMKEAIRGFQTPPVTLFKMLADAYWRTGQYKEAVAVYKKALHINPDYLPAHVGLAITYSLAGNDAEARPEVAEVLRIDPKYSLEVVQKESSIVNLKTAMSHNEADKQRVIEALRKAGLPEKPPLPLPDKPSIAVLPFENMSGDPEQEYFSDGLTEDIITALSKTPKLFVIARNSTFTYKGKPVKVQQVGRELGVKYVLEGSVRKSGDKVRITAQLVDAQTGHHLWAERYDRELKDIFAIQDEITIKIMTALQVQLTEGEQARLIGKGTNNLDAYLNYLKAREYLNQFTKETTILAKQLAEKTISLDPNFAYGYVGLGMTHIYDVWLGVSKSPKESYKRGIELAQKAIEIDPSLYEPHRLLAHVYVSMRRYDTAIAEAEKALELNPNSAHAYATLGHVLLFAAKPQEAITMIKKAIRLNPYPPSWYYANLAGAYKVIGHYDEAIQIFKKALEKSPDNLMALAPLTGAYVLAGRLEEARATAKEVLRVNPRFSVDRYARMSPFKDESHKIRNAEALRKVGLK